MTTILGLGGSLRPGSTTLLALRVALLGAEEAGAQTQLIDLAAFRLPLFDGTYTLDGYVPEEQQVIKTLLDLVSISQGVILASPTYHNTISGALKNALDILEVFNEDGPGRLEGKVVGVITVQGGTSGTGINTLTTLLLAARAMHGWVAPTMVSVPGSREAFDQSGLPRNPILSQRLRALGEEVARASTMFATFWQVDSLHEVNNQATKAHVDQHTGA